MSGKLAGLSRRRALALLLLCSAAAPACAYHHRRYYSHSHTTYDLLADLLVLYAQWVILHPLIGWPVTVVLSIAGYKVYDLTRVRYQDRVITRGISEQAGALLSQGLVQVRSKDPAFESGAFLQWAQETFLALRAALSRQDVSSVSRLLSDGMLERFSLQAERGALDSRDQIFAPDCEFLQAECAPSFDAVHVRFRARDFSEVWTFLRRCGERRWVLWAAVRSCDWSPRDTERDVPGLDAASEDDPALHPRLIEDRAAAAFWRWQRCLASRDASILGELATDGFRAAFALAGSPQSYGCGEASASAFLLLAFEPGPSAERAHVLVSWSGAKREKQEGCDAVLKHVLTLVRGEGGSRPWQAEAIVPVDRWEKPQVPDIASVLDASWAAPLAPAEAVSVMAAAMTADGIISEKELGYLRAFSEKQGIPEDRLASIVAAAQADRIEIPPPRTSQEAEACMRGLLSMSLADGRLTDSEMRLLLSFGARLSLRPEDVRAIVKEERRALYRKARQAS